MTKRLVAVVAVLIIAVSAGVAAGCGGELPDNTMAKVGETLITQEMFEARIVEFAAQYSIPPKEEDPEGWALFEKDVLEYLITYEMVAQKAEEYGIAVTNEDVQAELDDILANYYGGDQAKFNEDLAKYDMTLEGLMANYRESMLMQKVYEKVTSEVTEVPEADIAAYYAQNKARYAVDESRTTRHILIAPGGPATNTAGETTTTTQAALSEADWNKALAIANEVRAKLEAGGDWAELAKLYSDDTYSAVNGGDLGQVHKGQMVPEFEEAVFSLKVDELSKAIKTTYGYHVIQVTAISPARQYELDEVKDDITAALLGDLQSKAWTDWVKATKAELGVVYKSGYEPTTTTSTTSSGATDTTAAGEAIGTEPSTTATTAQ